MKKYILNLIICTLFFSTGLLGQKLNHVLGEVIVEVANDKGLQALLYDVENENNYKSPIQARQLLKEPMNVWVLSINPYLDNEIDFYNSIGRNKHTLLIQKNHIGNLRNTPNDPKFVDQWQYINTGQSGGIMGADIDMELAWDYTTGGLTTDGDSIVICVIDDGLLNDHEDIRPNLWSNRLEIPNNGIDDDGNGYIDDFQGWHAYKDNDDIYDNNNHGIQVAGVVGARGNNGIGVAGVNWNVKIMVVVGGAQNGEASALASYAYPYQMRKIYNETNGEKGAFVVATNASWGVDFGQAEDSPIWCSFYDELGRVGILNFAATINSSVDVDIQGDMPTSCSSNYLVAVTNMDHNDGKVSGAGYGLRSIDIGSFGVGTYTVRGSAYGTFGGTSAATPHVAGVAALLYSADCPSFISKAKSNPGQAALSIKDFILYGADANPALLGLTTTGGRLNAHKAVLNLLETCDDCSNAYGAEINNVSDVRGEMSWLDNGNVGEVILRYKSTEESTWTEVTDIAMPYEINDLTPCTSYEYQTKVNCADVNDSYSYSRVFKTDGCCDIPENIIVIVENEVAVINWDGVLAATNFVVEYKNIDSDTWIVVDLDEQNNFEIDNILDCQFYEMRVKTQCAASNNESPYSKTLIISGNCGACTLPYCEFSNKNISDEWIESVEIEGVFSNVSGVNIDGYGNYLGAFDINLITGSEYQIKLTPGYESTSFNEFFSAYIDYNHDGQFSDEEEIYADMSATQDSVSGMFVVPAGAPPGITRLRVVMRFMESSGPCDVAGFEYGETEDYCVNLISNLDCPLDYSADITSKTTGLIVYDIPEDDRIEAYILQYRILGNQDFITVQQETNVIAIVGLEECTTYEYRTAIVCNGVELAYTSIKEVKTKCESSTSDIDKQNQLGLSPNPSTGLVSIINRQNLQINEISIFSIEGQNMFSKKLNNNESNIAFDFSNLANGVYVIKLRIADSEIVTKWVKI